MTAVPEYNLALDELSIALSFATGIVIGAAPAPLVKAAAPAVAPVAVAPVPKKEETEVAKKVRIEITLDTCLHLFAWITNFTFMVYNLRRKRKTILMSLEMTTKR